MPNIRIEVDPNVAGDDDFTTLSSVPVTSAPGWSGYIDATATTTGLSGGSNLAGFDIFVAGDFCPWDELQELLGDGVEPPTILTVGIARGTSDFPWHGAVDGLRVDDTVYNFEEHGVTTAPPPQDRPTGRSASTTRDDPSTSQRQLEARSEGVDANPISSWPAARRTVVQRHHRDRHLGSRLERDAMEFGIVLRRASVGV